MEIAKIAIFKVYRETDKRANNPPTPMSTAPHAGPSNSPSGSSPSSGSTTRPDTGLATPPTEPPVLGGGALTRPRSASEGGAIDRNRERQLVGSLTTSYRFKESGLVKKVRPLLFIAWKPCFEIMCEKV